MLRVSPLPRGSLLLVNHIHPMGLPLSITNRIRFKGAPSSKRIVFSSRGFPQQGMGFLHRIPPFTSEWNLHQLRHPLQRERFRTQRVNLSKRMEFASRRSPSLKRMEFTPENHPLRANGILIKEVIPSIANGARF